MPHIVGFNSCIGSVVQLCGKMPKVNKWLMITFWVADPHDLHFILVVGKANVNLFVS